MGNEKRSPRQKRTMATNRLMRTSIVGYLRQRSRPFLASHGLDHLEEVTPGISKERDAETHCGYVVWLVGDGHVAAFQFVDDGVHAIDAETGVMPPRHVVAVMEIFIGGAFRRAGSGHQLEMKTIVPSRIKKSEAETSYRRRLPQSKIELVGIPLNGDVKVRDADGCVVDLERGKRAGGVRCGHGFLKY